MPDRYFVYNGEEKSFVDPAPERCDQFCVGQYHALRVCFDVRLVDLGSVKSEGELTDRRE